MQKSGLTVISILVLAFSMICCGEGKRVEKEWERDIVILQENDVHCNIDGYARLAGLRDSLSAVADVVVVSCGDYLQGGTAGAVSGGQYIADLMRNVGYDAVTLGNHEFDFGDERMFELLRSAKVPVTCVNMRDMVTGGYVYSPYIMRCCGKRRVAFVGVTTPTTLFTEGMAFYDKEGRQLYHLCQDSLYQVVQRNVDDARRAGADYVVVLAHLGENGGMRHANSHDLIKKTTGIDVLLDGHSHSVVVEKSVRDKEGKDVPVVQTGSLFENIGVIRTKPTGEITTELIDKSIPLKLDDAVAFTTDSIKRVMEKKVNEKVCYSPYTLRIHDDSNVLSARQRETNAGDLVTDAYRVMTGAEVAITNAGGLRTAISAGEITYGDLISLLPYENYVCVVSVPGSLIVETLEACCSSLPGKSGDFPQVSGIRFKVNPYASPRVTEVMVYDEGLQKYILIEQDREYRVATVDYCVTGGGLKKKLRHCKRLSENQYVYSMCVKDYIQRYLGDTIPEVYSKAQKRIVVKEERE